MSVAHEVSVCAHPNIYTSKQRDLKVYFSIPDHGVTKETGLFLFISGYGSNPNSNVYKKMRDIFTDKYNLITIQCDYFGLEHMQLIDKQEDLSNFNDMSLMQVLDNLNAVYSVIEILKQNNAEFNYKKIVCHGHSHGGYLSYFCNRIAPNLFSLIIDNSAYIEPIFMKGNHVVPSKKFNKKYLVSDMNLDNEIMNLRHIYNDFVNRSNIISFHGVFDQISNIIEKINFCNSIENCKLNVVNNDLTFYGGFFRSVLHGFDTDFLKFIEMVFDNYQIQRTDNDVISFKKQVIITSKNKYIFDMVAGIVVLQMEELY